MAQFHVYRNPRASRKQAPYLLDVQSDIVATQLRVVVPLVELGYFGSTATRLNPLLPVGQDSYVMSPGEIGALPLGVLGLPVGELSVHRGEILAALDFLLTGY